MRNAVLMIAGALAMATLEAPLTYAQARPAPKNLAQEPQIEGRYRVVGMGSDAAHRYTGEVEIKRTGDTYQLIWQIGQSRYAGTGFVFGSALSVVFVPSQGRPGVAVYDIGRDGTLSGRYTALGASTVAPEILQPADRL